MVKRADKFLIRDLSGMFLALGSVAGHHTKVNGRGVRLVQKRVSFTFSPRTVISSPASVVRTPSITSSGGSPGSASTNPTRLGTPSTFGMTQIRCPPAHDEAGR